MPASRPTPWLLCYDIADPRRLGRTYRRVRRYAAPVQYSVFAMTATRAGVANVLASVSELIDPRMDDLRAYPIMGNIHPVMYGNALAPEGIFCFDGGNILGSNYIGVSQDKGGEA